MRRFILTMAIALSILASGTANIGYAENSGFGDVTGAVLYYEDIRIYRDHKNMTNRYPLYDTCK